MLKKKVCEVVGTAKLSSEEDLCKIAAEDLRAVMKQIAAKEIVKRRVMSSFLDAWQPIEAKALRVSDVVMNAESYSLLRKYGKDVLEVSCSVKAIKRNFFGMMWGARVWVHQDAKCIMCYGENSSKFGKDFPFLAESKRILKIKD